MFYLREREILRKEAIKRSQLEEENKLANVKIDDLEKALKQLQL